MKYSNILILLLFFSCDFSEPSTDDPRIIEEVKTKINEQIAETLAECIQEATARAELAVDSTLRARALDEKLSIYTPPAKPTKPPQPVVPAIKDTSPIVPLKQKVKRPDTLGKKDSTIIED